MLTRREFLRTGALAVGAIPGFRLAGASLGIPQAYFGLHPFIERNSKAVFIRRTRVAEIGDQESKKREGLMLAREIFLPMGQPGIPITHRIVLKPNYMATAAQFYEGVVTGLKEVGLRQLHFVEANDYPGWGQAGYVQINERLGVQMNEPERRPRHLRENWDINWSTVPEAVVYKRIPHFVPVNEPDAWLLNIAKWKTHGMCMSLSVKNEQGLVVIPYTRFCVGWRMVTGVPDFMKPDIQPNVEAVIKKFFDRHVKLNYDRYDSRAKLTPMDRRSGRTKPATT